MATAAVAPWAPEPLLDENPDRYCMFPLKEDRVWSQYKKAEASRPSGQAPNDPLCMAHVPGGGGRSDVPCRPTCRRPRFGRVGRRTASLWHARPSSWPPKTCLAAACCAAAAATARSSSHPPY